MQQAQQARDMKIIDDPQELQRIMAVRNRIAAENIVNFVDSEDDILAAVSPLRLLGGSLACGMTMTLPKTMR